MQRSVVEERKVGPLEQDYVKLQPQLLLRLFSKPQVNLNVSFSCITTPIP